VPEDSVGKSFEYLFMSLLKKKLICMALYRLKGATDNEFPYVYTNPESDTIISHRDRAFVLGIEIPDELRGDMYELVEKDKEVELGTNEPQMA
jgi:acetyl-CoA C-acetyltransferase/potassium large conductance calcium-activated channel subfamily M alpha protein 1